VRECLSPVAEAIINTKCRWSDNSAYCCQKVVCTWRAKALCSGHAQ